MDQSQLYARIRASGGIADLSARAKFWLRGADRLRYLNGQVTNDIRKLGAEESLYACVTTAKGKMSGDVFITSLSDYFLLDAEPSLQDTLAARLERYIIADDVTIEDATEEMGMLHWLEGVEERGTEEIPGAAVVHRVRSNRFGIPGTDLIGPREQTEVVLTQLSNTVPIIDAGMLEVLRIEAGIPRWGFELGEDTLPPEAGLDRTSIDYHKGCYIGQEVISRIKSVGHVNKTLHGFVGDSPLAAGMELFQGDKPAGRLTSAAYSFGLETHAALGYLKRGIDAPTLTARTADGGKTCTVEVKELPLCERKQP